MNNNTKADITLKYKDRQYNFIFDFKCDISEDSAEYLFEDGNYACDCNRSLFIKQHCDKNFKQLSCGGDEIELIKIKILNGGT